MGTFYLARKRNFLLCLDTKRKPKVLNRFGERLIQGDRDTKPTVLGMSSSLEVKVFYPT